MLRVECAARVHDVGKIIVSPEILEKPGRLSPCEYAEIQRHAVFGARLVASLGDPVMTAIVRHHHERIDGSGYPDRLRGEEIPLGARIIAVADTFDALTSARPYREARLAERSDRAVDRRGAASPSTATRSPPSSPERRLSPRPTGPLLFPTPLRRLLAAALLCVALGGGIYLLLAGDDDPRLRRRRHRHPLRPDRPKGSTSSGSCRRRR